MRAFFLRLASLAAAAALSWAFAQSHAPTLPAAAAQPAVIRTETRLVLVDAIVRDNKGKIVSDLRGTDFRLWEDGKEQTIKSVSLVDAGAAGRSEPEYIAFLFDTSGIAASGRVAAEKDTRQDVAGFAGAYASPNRYMAVIDFNGDLSIAQNFTPLADRVQRAARDISHVADAGSSVHYRIPGRLPAEDAIRAIANSMAAINGRKALVVLSASPGLRVFGPSTTLARDCNKAKVAVYTTNPAFEDLAKATGGRSIGKSLVHELGEIAAEQETGYVLGFKPVESPDGSCHWLQVKAARHSPKNYSINSESMPSSPPIPLAVQARDAYCNVQAPDLLAGKIEGKALEANVAAPGAGNASASMELPYFYSSPGIALVDLAMEMDVTALQFTKQKNGKQHAELDLVGLAYGTDGEVAGRFSDAVPLDFDTPEEAQFVRQRPYRYERQFRLPSGRYNLRVVFGSGERSFGKLEAPLTIHPWDGQRLALSGIALASDTRKVTDLTSDLDPSLFEGHKDLIAKSLKISPSGSNSFRGSALCFGYLEIHDSLLAGPNPPRYILNVRVLDRRTGEEKAYGVVDAADFIHPGKPLAPVLLNIPIASLPRGSYGLEVTASRSPGNDSAIGTAEFQIVEEAAKAPGGDAAQEAAPAESGPPSSPEQERLLASARQVALEYAGRLPNFLCTETVRRSVNLGRGLVPTDTLTVEVGYYQRQETYRLTEVNGAPAGMRYSDAMGTVSRGELGANMRTIFDPASAGEFHFERWTSVGGRRAAVYSYRVERSKAHYVVTAQGEDTVEREETGLRGEATIDRETSGILRLHYLADAIPPGFPIRRMDVTVDYGNAGIAGMRYFLPLKAAVETQLRSRTSRNEVTFHSYRKFSSESSLSFGEADAPAPQP